MRRRHAPKPPSLQLTSLLDMFTIILVFLLQSFQAEDEDLTLHAGLELPVSDARYALEPALHLAVDRGGVFVEGARVLDLVDGVPAPALRAAGEADAVTDAVRRAAGDADEAGRVATVQADRHVPYDTVDLVMRSAARAGCTKFRLVIAKE